MTHREAYAVTYCSVIGMLFFCLRRCATGAQLDTKASLPLINHYRVEREDGPLLGNIVETISGFSCASSAPG